MRTRVWLLTAALLVPGAPAPAGDRAERPEPRATVDEKKGIERLDAVLPGELVSYALPRLADEGRDVLLLIRPGDGEKKKSAEEEPQAAGLPPCPAEEDQEAPSRPLSLYRLDVGSAALTMLRQDLPGDTTAIDSAGTVILARPGQLLEIDPESPGNDKLLVDDPDLHWRSRHPRAVRDVPADDPPWITATGLGTLTLYGPKNGAASWEPLARVDLPLTADARQDGIRVWTTPPRAIGRDGHGTLYFATPPESFGQSRVQTTLVAVDPDGSSSVTDCWARLPKPEDVLGFGFLIIDESPVLLVTTKPAEKLNLFGEKRLRLYPLERDRSRLGVLPLFAVETKMNLWQEGRPWLLDINGDGLDDLVIGYWKGIVQDIAVLDVYPRRADGTFQGSARSTELEVPKGDRDFVAYGHDLTGDGIPDLLVRGKRGFLVYPGRPSSNGKRIVGERPRVIRSADQGKEAEEGERPRLADLDGDGTDEILLVKPGDAENPGQFRWVRLTR